MHFSDQPVHFYDYDNRLSYYLSADESFFSLYQFNKLKINISSTEDIHLLKQNDYKIRFSYKERDIQIDNYQLEESDGNFEYTVNLNTYLKDLKIKQYEHIKIYFDFTNQSVILSDDFVTNYQIILNKE